MTKISTPHDHLYLLNAGWEVRVALDFGFRQLFQGLKSNPTQKPVLLFLPKGASEILLMFLLGFLTRDARKEVVMLIEDETTALAVDRSTDAPGLELFRKKGRVVIGDLANLAKTDSDSYGACVILGYGAEFPAIEGQHVAYFRGKANHVARLCGWSSHLLYIDQPFRDAPEHVLEDLKPGSLVREDYVRYMLERSMGEMAYDFADSGRRVNVIASDHIGCTVSAAASYYIKLFRVSGNGKNKNRMSQGVPSYFLLDEETAAKLYQSQNKSCGCHFMEPDMYVTWLREKAPKDAKIVDPKTRESWRI